MWEQISKCGYDASIVHGDLDIHDRLLQLDKFRNERRILISTNILSRAIDVPKCRIVVNFDMATGANGNAPTLKIYQLRISRAGRFGSHGIAINLLDSFNTFKKYQLITKYFDFEIKKNLMVNYHL